MSLHMYWKRSRLSQAKALVRNTCRRRFGTARRKLDEIPSRRCVFYYAELQGVPSLGATLRRKAV
ncbi:hypothetical protein B7P43_G06819 [Cryptotermes secundus]|uniref:Uncharacterized protein n=1 Tax=Cryptotermes secundus TaxID=105785 RepID=A0A2J7QDL1_9NEOP|nr:hypothetical protein B7P43_G06819 [Cryptotermes secundus]